MPKRFKRILKYFSILIFIGIVGVLGFYFSVKHGAFGPIYDKEDLLNYKNETASLILSEDAVIIGKFFDKNRTNANFKDFPDHLINALIATEDARFYEHKGVDSRSLIRVVFKSILMGNKRSGGGSTITQQLAKNMTGRSNFGFLSMPVNKTKEIVQAQRIEDIYTKEDILTLYLNTVAFGENIYGAKSAALRYFNKDLKDLNIEESAVLVGILKANTYYNPHLNPKNALKRRNVVLKQMQAYDYLEAKTVDSLSKLELRLNYNNLNSNNPSGHFLSQVEKKATKLIDSINKADKTSYNLKKDGLIIKTTLNAEMQNYAHLAFAEHLAVMQKKLDQQYTSAYQKKKLKRLVDAQLKRLNINQDSAKVLSSKSIFNWKAIQYDSISTIDSLMLESKLLHGGLLALSPKTGAIKTYVGGINFQRYAYDQVFSQRQVASTFKPILYATAIENGKQPCDYLDNEEIKLSEYPDWHPSNADGEFGGKYSLQGALLNSKNVPTINLYLETNFTHLDTVWNRLKFSSQLKNEPSLALGTANASIYELANAYANFANYGKVTKPYFIETIMTSKGDILYEHKTQKLKEVLNEKTAAYINEILQNAINRGTGTRLRTTYGVQLPLAGKTGTSQDYTDAWFVGYNPDIVMVSRVGCNSPKIHFNNGLGSGSSLALPLVAKTLKQIQSNPKLKKEHNTKFKTLSDIDKNSLSCEDFKEKTDLENFFDLFKRKETSFDKQQERAKRRAERIKKREERRAKKN